MTTSVLNQNMAYGVKPPHLGDYVLNLGESADYMFDHAIFNDNMCNVDFCGQMVKETNPGVYEKAKHTDAPNAAHPWLQNHCRYYGFTQSFYREMLPGISPGIPVYKRNVLPDGRPAYTSFNFGSWWRKHDNNTSNPYRLLCQVDEIYRIL